MTFFEQAGACRPRGSGRPSSDCNVIGDKHGITNRDCLPQSLSRATLEFDAGQTPQSDAMLSCMHFVGGKLESSNDEVDSTCLCFDVGVIRAGYATRTPRPAGQDGHHRPRSMWAGYAQRGRCLRENSRSPCRQQVRPWSDLLVGRFGRQHRATKRHREATVSVRAGHARIKSRCPCDVCFCSTRPADIC